MRHQTREGNEHAIEVHPRMMFDVIIGQGLLRGGWIKRVSRRWASSVLWRLLSNDRTDEGENTYAMADVCLAFLHHTPYLFCTRTSMDLICKRAAWSRAPAGTDDGTRSTTLAAEREWVHGHCAYPYFEEKLAFGSTAESGNRRKQSERDL